MAGTGWKATGTVLIVLGAVLILTGIGGAAVGGLVANDAVSDAGNCTRLNCDKSAGDLAEGGAILAIIGGGAIALGAIIAILGTVFVFIGVSRARREEMRVLAAARPRDPSW